MGPLFIGLASIKRKDSSAHRQELFSAYLNSHFLPGLLLKKYPFQSSFLNFFIHIGLGIYPLLMSLRMKIEQCPEDKRIAIFEYANEIRHIQARQRRAILNTVNFSSFHYANLFYMFSYFFFSLSKSRRFFYISRKLVLKNGALIGARQAQFLFFYALSVFSIKKLKTVPRHFYISTESNASVIGFALAAKKNGGKIIYINHGFLDQHLGLFFHDVIVTQGSALYERIRPSIIGSHSHIMVGNIFSVLPLNFPHKLTTIGFALSINPNADRIERIILEINQCFPSSNIEVRPHPNLVFSQKCIQMLSKFPFVKILPWTQWKDFSPQWDLAIAGNTSAHIDLIAKGIMSLGMDIDSNPHDLYHFYKNRFIYFTTNIEASWPTDLKVFYGSAAWVATSKTYLPDIDAFMNEI